MLTVVAWLLGGDSLRVGEAQLASVGSCKFWVAELLGVEVWLREA